MAVQAHYPSPNTFGSSDPGIGMRSNNNIWEDFQFQHNLNLNHNTNNQLGHRNLAAQMLNVTVFSEPESELTCNASGRKRARDNQIVAGDDVFLKTQQLYHHHQQQQSKVHVVPDNLNFYEPGNDSGSASTSGRTEQLELEALIRFQNQKLRLMVEETRKKQNRTLLGLIEQRTLKKLAEKETELERANRANMELEEKVKQMSAENQMWFNVAKNSEATVSSLRLSLEQVLLHNAGNRVAAEGFGETSGGGGEEEEGESRPSAAAAAEEEERNWEILKKRKSCKCCGGNDASFLVLPCRHLCLCGDCECRVHSCPVCNTVKNSTLQVFMS